MTELELEVLMTLKHGRYHPIRSQQIANLTELPERRVRQIIRTLIKLGYPIAAATEAPAGYFITETRDEVNHYAQSLRNRLIEDALRRRDFLRATKTKVEPQQLEMIA